MFLEANDIFLQKNFLGNAHIIAKTQTIPKQTTIILVHKATNILVKINTYYSLITKKPHQPHTPLPHDNLMNTILIITNMTKKNCELP